MKNELGRSMVEILGVLAVMGVVGLVGVKMYTNAMNRHRANELIYEAQKRATMVASQMLSGRDTLSVAGFTDPAGYHFGVEKNPTNDKQFNITITGVPADICTKMKTFVGAGTPIRVISEYCDKLTFNNDLSKTAYASDSQTETECTDAGNTWCGGAGACQSASNCCEGKTLGPCEACSEGAIVTSPMEGKACDYDNDGFNNDGYCRAGTCEPLPDGMACTSAGCTCSTTVTVNDVEESVQGTVCSVTSNAVSLCCPPGSFCNSGGDVNTTDTANQARCITLQGDGTNCSTNAECPQDKPFCHITWPKGTPRNCHDPSAYKGTCTALGTPITANIYGLGNVLISSGKLIWWSARNWCEAHGKHLINVEDFQAYSYKNNVNYLISTGLGTTKPACKQGKTCTRWDNAFAANAMWQNGWHLTDARDENGELYRDKYSPVVLDLVQQSNGILLWTASDFNKTNSCSAFILNAARGILESQQRSSDSTGHALCH